MRFEVTYSDASKVIVEVPEPELREFLDGRAKLQAIAAAEKTQDQRGLPLGIKVV